MRVKRIVTRIHMHTETYIHAYVCWCVASFARVPLMYELTYVYLDVRYIQIHTFWVR
jgi:hypothetical protein